MSRIDFAAELASFDALTNFELRNEWRRLHRRQPPRSLSRDLLQFGLAYKIQERSFGGLSKSQLRKLTGENGSTAGAGPHRRSALVIKPGTRLVREWHGVTHAVLVLENGVEWNGHRYRSLSVVAREITGAHWSGPRFFGLAKREACVGD